MKSLLEMFPRASQSFMKANETPNRSEASSSVPQQSTGKKSLGIDQGKTGNSSRCVLRYTSRRCRLLDEDNWCTKFFTDALRYCGALSNDTPDKVTISVMQEKVAHRCQEETVIELEYPPPVSL
jgi:hypothetical protein